MNYTERDMEEVVLDNYLGYGVSTIVDRAIPRVEDGLKPVQRRILYSMAELKLFNDNMKLTDKVFNKAKCTRIQGDTMGKYHPHGDSSIYDALCRMTHSNGVFNAPLIRGHGSLGKVNQDLKPAAPRYTEAGLMPIARELFDGIKEDAVDMVPNYDDTLMEPDVLPVKFPNVLVNTSAGIAVGMSSNIPSFNLRSVCNATIAILEGKANSPEDLVDIIGAPDFTTGGYVHVSDNDVLQLLKTGRASIKISGSVQLFKDSIVITEVPYGVTIDKILDEIEECSTKDENGVVKIDGISRVYDGSDEHGMRGIVILKKGVDPRAVLRKINVYTQLRTSIGFITRVIYNGKSEEVGVYSLLKDMWIPWRVKTIRRQKSFELGKKSEHEHLLKTWEIISDKIEEVVKVISSNTEEDAKTILKEDYGLDSKQADYLLDMKIRQITRNRVSKAIKELEELRDEISVLIRLLNNDEDVDKYIAVQLREIADKYGTDRVTTMTEPIVIDKKSDVEVEVIEDREVNVLITNKGYIKKINNVLDVLKAEEYMTEGDSIIYNISCNNREEILVFTYSGYCYKIPVNSIESTRGKFRELIWNLVKKKKDNGDILYITNSGDYSESFNVVYGNGRGRKIWTDAVSGKRECYKSLYDAGDKDSLFICKEDEFFMITKRRRAAYINLRLLTELRRRDAFKVAKIKSDDGIFGLQPAKRVPDMSKINTERYRKGYCVSIGEDKLW